MIDEGPSADDLARFGGNTGYCPQCGEEIWDQADRCPSCGNWIGGGTGSRPPVAAEVRNRIIVAVAVITLLAFLGLFGAVRLF